MIQEDSQEHYPETGNEDKNQTKNEDKNKAMDVPVKPPLDEAEIMRVMANWSLRESKLEEDKPETNMDNPSRPTAKKKMQMTEKDYFETFFKIPIENASNGKSVYIRPEYHHKFLKLIAVLEIHKLTIYAYVDNIIEHHFKEFEELIQKIYQDRNKPIF